MKKLQLFHQNHGQKCQFCLLLKSMFILSRKACFLTRTSPNTFSGCILQKTTPSQNFKFLTKPWTNPFAKIPILWVFETDVFSVQKRLFSIQNVENRFFTIYFHDLRHGNTGGYKKLQGLKGGYKGLKGVTGGYVGLQGVLTKIMDYPLCKNTNFAFFLNPCLYCLKRLVFLTRTLPNTSSGHILYKTKRSHNFKFLTKTMD